MKSWIKKLEYFPATLLEAVYKNGTNKNLATILDEHEAEMDTVKADVKLLIDAIGSDSARYIDTIKGYSGKLTTFKGEFDLNNLKTYRAGDVGDFWIYKGNMTQNIDSSVLFPGGIVYVDTAIANTTAGETINILRTIYVPYQNHTIQKDKYDVIIVGAGAGGIGAAYALKDSGLRVALIERLDTLGGTHINGGVGLMIATPVGDWYKEICQTAYDEGMMDFFTPYLEVGEGTTFEKRWRGSLFRDPKNVINNYQGRHLNINGVWFSDKYYDDLKKTIDIFINTEVVEVHSDSGKIYEIKTIDRLTGKESVFVADYFVDCSADAVLFTKNADLALDTDYYIGTDGRSRFSETVYSETEEPNKYGINTVEPCYYQMGGTKPNGTPFEKAPSFYKTFDNIKGKMNFTWSPPKGNIAITSNSYGTGMILKDFIEKSTEYNMGDGYDRAKAYFYQTGYYAAASRFAGICKMLAIRESYRVACEKTVDQNYLTTQITSENLASEKTMALSTWYVDIHNQPYYCVSNIANGIPYGAMVPKCYTNVLVASRCYGASHIGLSSLRLVKTMLDLGYSAGKAMAQAVVNQLADVREVDTAQVQADTGIANTMREVETYFYGDTVDYVEVTE